MGTFSNSDVAHSRVNKNQNAFMTSRQDKATTKVILSKKKKGGSGLLDVLGFTLVAKPSTSMKRLRTVQPSMEAACNNFNQADIRFSNNSRIQMAIADMIHSDGVSFFMASSKRFRKVLTLAKTVGPD